MWPSVASRKHIHIEKIRKLLGKFLWRGNLCRIERYQLSLKAKSGGLVLINVDLKAKTLFIKNLLTMPNDYIYANSARLRNWVETPGNGVNVRWTLIGQTK
jgi:hypothetical protein